MCCHGSDKDVETVIVPITTDISNFFQNQFKPNPKTDKATLFYAVGPRRVPTAPTFLPGSSMEARFSRCGNSVTFSLVPSGGGSAQGRLQWNQTNDADAGFGMNICFIGTPAEKFFAPFLLDFDCGPPDCPLADPCNRMQTRFVFGSNHLIATAPQLMFPLPGNVDNIATHTGRLIVAANNGFIRFYPTLTQVMDGQYVNEAWKAGNNAVQVTSVSYTLPLDSEYTAPCIPKKKGCCRSKRCCC